MATVLDRVTSTTTLSNTAAETTMYTFSVPANMGAKLGQVLDLMMDMTFQNNSGADRTYTLRVKFGGTTHIADALIAMPATANIRAATIKVRIQNTGSSVQNIIATASVSAAQAATRGDFSTAPLMAPSTMIAIGAIDQTAAQTLAVTVQSDAATATQTVVTFGALLTLT